MHPQSAILPEPRRHSLFVTLEIPGLSDDARTVAKACAALPQALSETSQADAQVVGSVSFSEAAWKQLGIEPPPGMRTFRAVGNAAKTAPATGGDVFFHLNSDRADLNYETLRKLLTRLRAGAAIVDEAACVQYLDSRDLTGFIDGTENPEGDAERAETALIDSGEFQGGSFLFMQRYEHDLEKWMQRSDGEQEKIIGRTKADSIELPDDARPDTAHISRVVIEEDGEELEIVRHSMPYFSLSGIKGLVFIAYTKDLDIIDKMLARMFGTAGDGLHDHLLDYTQPVTGAMFFTPSLELLQTIAT